MKQLTKERLKPLNDRMYEIIEGEFGGFMADGQETESSEYGKETADEYNARITSDAIKIVLEEVESSLASAWFSDPSQYYFPI